MKRLLIASLICFSTISFAGNGSTGGGNIYGNQLNPWFLSNTKNVNYCVEISTEFSSLPFNRVLNLVEESIQYWKKTFKDYTTTFYQDFEGDFTLGTQTFTFQTECNAQTDIRFQLGFLTDEQEKQFPNYKQMLGMAHRTHYDEVNLKGKGFIYLAAEEGKFRPTSSNLHPRPWSTGKNHSLKYALIHELGHVFGLQDHHYSYAGIMSARFVDLITSTKVVRQSNTIEESMIAYPFGCNSKYDSHFNMEIEHVTFGDYQSETSPAKEKLMKLLGLPQKKFKMDFISQAGKAQIKVDKKLWGEINLKIYNADATGGMAPAITLYLTNKQNVFKDIPKKAYNSHVAIYHVSTSAVKKNEVLKLQNGNSLNVFIKYDESCMPQVGTVIDNEPFMDIFLLN
jgi:hypothetical protein